MCCGDMGPKTVDLINCGICFLYRVMISDDPTASSDVWILSGALLGYGYPTCSCVAGCFWVSGIFIIHQTLVLKKAEACLEDPLLALRVLVCLSFVLLILDSNPLHCTGKLQSSSACRACE